MSYSMDFDALAIWAGKILISWCRTHCDCSYEDAEDAAQHALVKAWENRDKFHGHSDSQFRKWLLRTAHNYLVSSFRKSNRMRTLAPDEWSAQATVADDHELVDGLLELPEAINKLRPEYKEILSLYYLEDLTMPETADRLNMSVTNVWKRIHRARREMRELME